MSIHVPCEEGDSSLIPGVLRDGVRGDPDGEEQDVPLLAEVDWDLYEVLAVFPFMVGDLVDPLEFGGRDHGGEGLAEPDLTFGGVVLGPSMD